MPGCKQRFLITSISKRVDEALRLIQSDAEPHRAMLDIALAGGLQLHLHFLQRFSQGDRARRQGLSAPRHTPRPETYSKRSQVPGIVEIRHFERGMSCSPLDGYPYRCG